ncbi:MULTISPECIES: hypothetical protein [unclassified Rhodococcus (in: high G+C Gram-positive bacteria)]|uniref:hypothetical protein n=1 Tax=unclassified Rhodococcus (in: high G+C Gram-positive bacteria) TaxID=192944 RepID=UPI00146D94AA|nr:hypothetical protein [Rhodococcus sp. 105337]
MLYLLALIGAVTLAVLLWKAYGPNSGKPPARVVGPDDDPEFLWKVDREVRRRPPDDTARPDPDSGDTGK